MPGDLEWEIITSEMRKTGSETTYASRCFTEGGSVTWTVTEHPAGELALRATYADGIEVIQDFALSIAERVLE